MIHLRWLILSAVVLTILQGPSSLGYSAWAFQSEDFSVLARKTRKGLEVIATPPSGVHINIQAPMSLETETKDHRYSPWSAQEEEVIFLLPLQIPGPFLITLFLCDEKKTFCEKHKVSFLPEKKIRSQ